MLCSSGFLTALGIKLVLSNATENTIIPKIAPEVSRTGNWGLVPPQTS